MYLLVNEVIILKRRENTHKTNANSICFEVNLKDQ
ncbi:MAG: hypothetical protein K0S53_1171 [Bacteroidetes bacterium]|jgi:hypothetical protein|nr:hypothetical protein [Bacteroidota bacterium]MDF2451766.1 hypothetical protein [Bacteroidota bacterium]